MVYNKNGSQKIDLQFSLLTIQVMEPNITVREVNMEISFHQVILRATSLKTK